MKERRMNEALLENFPELTEKFDNYTSWQDGMDTGAFLTYEDIFLPAIIEAIDNDNAEFLDRVAGFVEEQLTSRDEYASNVIYVGILEGLKAGCEEAKVTKFLKGNALNDFKNLTY